LAALQSGIGQGDRMADGDLFIGNDDFLYQEP
jgi:hypothetical protein